MNIEPIYQVSLSIAECEIVKQALRDFAASHGTDNEVGFTAMNLVEMLDEERPEY